jgi:hypothetical protein
VSVAVEHPTFGTVTFAFDDDRAESGFAATDGFVFLGIEYPRFDFAFERAGSGFVSGELNNRTMQMLDGRRRPISEIAPTAFRSFVLSKARELAKTIQAEPVRGAQRRSGRSG